MDTTATGIFFMGFVFGYLLYYAVRHSKEFNIDLLSSAIGAVGGGAVIGLFEKNEHWIGPYGIGIGCGFLFYLILALILIGTGDFKPIADNKVMLVAKTLLGTPRQHP
jgi:O-antigen/teichoic acid export membrane protein